MFSFGERMFEVYLFHLNEKKTVLKSSVETNLKYIFDCFFLAEYNKYYDSEIASTLRLKEILPSASKELDGIICAAKGIKAGVNAGNKAIVIKYYEILSSSLIALLPKLSQYPTLVPVLLTNIAEIEKLINGLSDGTATFQDVNESNKLFATILDKTIPK